MFTNSNANNDIQNNVRERNEFVICKINFVKSKCECRKYIFARSCCDKKYVDQTIV